MKLYLLIPGVNGGSQVADHVGWFEIDSYDLDLQALLSDPSGGGSGVGRTEFSPLTVGLALNSGLAEILRIVAQGQRLQGIKIEGWSEGGDTQKAFELVLADVSIKSLHDEKGPGDSLVFNYDQIGVTTYAQSPTGGTAVAQSFGYDRDGGVIPPPTLTLPPGTANSGGSGGSKFFLLIPGVNGGSQDEDHAGWFEIDSYELDLLAALSDPSGGGSGTGRTEFSPLTVNLALNSGLAEILQIAAQGQLLPGIKIEGIKEGEAAQKVFELTLANVRLKSVHEETGAGDSLVFDYSQIGVTTYASSPTGGTVVAQTFGYDLSTSGLTSPPVVTGPPGPENADGGGSKFFLLIPGVNGGSQDEDHVGWFEIDSYELDLLAALSDPTGGGSGVGRTDFSPLTVNLALNSGLAEVLRIAAQGQRLPGIKVEGWTEGAEPRKTLELTLADVRLKSVHEGDGTGDTLVFDYNQIGLTTFGQTGAGQAAPPQTFGFDLETNSIIEPPTIVPTLSISPPAVAQQEGGFLPTMFEFTVTRTGDLSEASTVAWAVAGNGLSPADGSDFTGGVLPAGTLSFAANEASKTIVVNVAGDGAIELNESFTVTLSSATGATIATAAASATIVNDDVPTVQGTAGNNTLVGTKGSDVYDPRGGVDVIRDRGGSDVYLISDGRLDLKTVVEAAGAGGGAQDVLWLTGALAGNVVALGRTLPANIERLQIDPAFNGIALRDLSGLNSDWAFNFSMDADSLGRLGEINTGAGRDTLALNLTLLPPNPIVPPNPIRVLAGSVDDIASVNISGIGGQQPSDPHRVLGEAGNDALTITLNDLKWDVNGGVGNDIITLLAGTTSVITTLAATQGGEVHGGDGLDLLIGSSLDDRLFGEAHADIVNAAAGNDLVSLGSGVDVGSGGAGTDTFVLSQGRDTILDFQDRTDRMGLTDGLTFASLTVRDSLGGVVISSGEYSMQLLGVRAAQIAASDFVLL